MRQYNTFHDAYVENLKLVYNNPQFYNAPRGFRSREVLNNAFVNFETLLNEYATYPPEGQISSSVSLKCYGIWREVIVSISFHTTRNPCKSIPQTKEHSQGLHMDLRFSALGLSKSTNGIG